MNAIGYLKRSMAALGFPCMKTGGAPYTGGGGITPTPTPTPLDTPVLANLSSGWATGQNPPAWQSTYLNVMAYNAFDGSGDQVRARWRLDGGAWTTTGWEPLDDELASGDAVAWAFLTDGSLDAGGDFDVQEQTVRDLGLGTEQMSAWSASWSDALDAAGGTPWAFDNLLMEGDSHTAGSFYYSGAWLALRGWTAASDGDPATVLAVGGSGIDTVVSRLATALALDPSIVTLPIGPNDLFSYTAQDYYDACIAYFDSVRAGTTNCIFGLAEMLPLDPNAAANSPPANDDYNSLRGEFAALVRAGVGVDFDFVIPFGSAPIFPDAAGADTDLFSDGLHPDGTAARVVLVAVYEAAVAPAIAGVFTGTTPDDFAVNDVDNADPSTDYIIDFGPIEGLGVGQKTVFSKVSGTGLIARGNQDVGTAFGVSDLELMNGDYGRIKIPSSADDDTGVSLVFDVGGVEKTATVTTAAGGAGNTMVMNGADKNAGLTLAGDNLTVSAVVDPQAPRLIRSTVAFTGKCYAEMTINNLQGVFLPGFGVCDLAASLSATPGDSNARGGGTGPFGSIFPSQTWTVGSSTLAPGDVVMLACDTATRKLWMGKNGTWAPTTNPATGTNGEDVGALAQFYLWVSLQRGPNDNVTVNTGGPFAFTPPAGFGPMP